MENSVDKERLSEEILSSNLSDGTKIELFRIIFKDTAQVMPLTIPYNTKYPYNTQCTTQNPNNNLDIIWRS